MKLVGIYNAPAIVTMAGLVCGFTAIWCAYFEKPEFAVIALIWAGIFDIFDGMVARLKTRTSHETQFGIEIDSLVDVVSFGVAPIFVAVSLGMNGLLFGVICALYLCAVTQRLAYFNVLQTQSDNPINSYTGLPVTFAALIFGIGFSFKEILSASIYHSLLITLFALLTFLYIAPITIPKPKGIIYISMPLLAILITAYWLILAWQT